jgi:WD40 repeat protein
MYQQTHSTPPPLRNLVPTLSPDVERVILQALAKDPKFRFSSVEAFANALENACQRSTRGVSHKCIYRGHASSVSALAWSPDGRCIASTDYHERIHIWDAMTGVTRSVDSHTGRPGPIGGVAWSPSGQHIAFGNRSTETFVRTLATRQDQDFDGICGKVDTITWSPSGSRLASGCIGKVYGDSLAYIVQVWETATKVKENIFTQYFYLPLGKGRDWLSLSTKGGFVSMKWLPDNTHMTFVNLDKTVETWDISAQKPVFVRHFHGRNGEAQRAALSPDGRRAASLLADQTVEVWDIGSGDHICTYQGHQDQVNVIAWSPDSRHVASGSHTAVHVWDAKTGKHVFTYTGHSSGINVLAWSPDGRHIASASGGQTVHTWLVEGL